MVPEFSNHFSGICLSDEKVSRKHRSNTYGVSGLGQLVAYFSSDFTRALATIERSSGMSRHLDELSSRTPKVI